MSSRLASELPLPSKILATPGYDPTRHYMPEAPTRHVATVPGTPFVLRWFPYSEKTVRGITDTFGRYPEVDCLTDVLGYHLEHTQLLKDAGIPVADYKAEVLPHNPSLPGWAAIYYATWRHPGVPLSPADERGHQLPKRLCDYYMELDPDGLCMEDVNRPYQYMVGGGAPLELVDFDPRLAPADIRYACIGHPELQSWLGYAVMAAAQHQT